MVLRVLLAAALGAAVGYQRQQARKPAGLRDDALIALGAALFTVVSISGFSGAVDPSRVAAGIVTGIGFIGAGVIFRGHEGVSGLTTAASIWVTAAIGMAAGAGLYLIAVVVTAITIGILMISKIRT